MKDKIKQAFEMIKRVVNDPEMIDTHPDKIDLRKSGRQPDSPIRVETRA